MSTPTWHSGPTPIPPKPTPLGWFLAATRGFIILIILITGLGVLGLTRLIETRKRGLSPHITQTVCRLCLAVLGLRIRRIGAPLNGAGAIVANHSSWLDILVLNAGQRITFVSKSEVANWPGIGTLARATGTLFIERKTRDAAAHVTALRTRLEQGQQLLFFPEGTSTDGRQVLDFKTTLFAAFLDPALQPMTLQPVTLSYAAPASQDPRFYGWWGDMDLGPHLLAMLATWHHGTVTAHYAPTQVTTDFENRKSLAATLGQITRENLQT